MIRMWVSGDGDNGHCGGEGKWEIDLQRRGYGVRKAMVSLKMKRKIVEVW